MMAHFGTYLKALRTSRGITLEATRDELRDRFGEDVPSLHTIAKWENEGATGMSAASLAMVATVYEADFTEVFSQLISAQRAAAAYPAPRRPPMRAPGVDEAAKIARPKRRGRRGAK